MVAVAREVFSVPEEVETRLWNKYTRDTFELLDKSESTLQVPDFAAIDNSTGTVHTIFPIRMNQH
jgi:hypothetical protein